MKLTKAALLGGASHFGVQLGRDIALRKWLRWWPKRTEPAHYVFDDTVRQFSWSTHHG
jgi:hypothetical protein